MTIQILLIVSVGVIALFLLRATAGAGHQAIRRVLASSGSRSSRSCRS